MQALMQMLQQGGHGMQQLSNQSDQQAGNFDRQQINQFHDMLHQIGTATNDTFSKLADKMDLMMHGKNAVNVQNYLSQPNPLQAYNKKLK